MASEQTSGSQTATIDTEHTLATVASAGTYVLAVDLSNMADGDTVVLRAATKVTSAGTSRQLYSASFAGVQADPHVHSIPVPAPHEVVFTLEQDGGTGRTFPWAVYSL